MGNGARLYIDIVGPVVEQGAVTSKMTFAVIIVPVISQLLKCSEQLNEFNEVQENRQG